MTDTKTAVRARILELCAQRGITVNRLATLSGVTQSTLNERLTFAYHYYKPLQEMLARMEQTE